MFLARTPMYTCRIICRVNASSARFDEKTLVSVNKLDGNGLPGYPAGIGEDTNT